MIGRAITRDLYAGAEAEKMLSLVTMIFSISPAIAPVIGGWIVFAHTPDVWSLLGMCVIAACGAAGAWLTLREHRSLRTAVLQPIES